MLKRSLIFSLIFFVGFVVGIYVSDKVNWRVFVLHDSQRVTIKVK